MERATQKTMEVFFKASAKRVKRTIWGKCDILAVFTQDIAKHVTVHLL